MIGLMIFFSTTVFATDFIITPKFGAAYIYAKHKNKGDYVYGDIKPSKAKWVSGVAGLGVGVVTDSGIMMLFNNDLHFGGAIKSRKFTDSDGRYDIENFKGGLYFWQSALILGYSFKPMDNLACNFGVGLAFGFANAMVKQHEYGKPNETTTYREGTHLTIPRYHAFPIHFNVQYFLTENIGLTVELQDVIGSIIASVSKDPAPDATEITPFGPVNLFNNFSFKLGPAFKF